MQITPHIPRETSYGLKVVEPYMDKVLVFAQTEKDLVNNKDLDNGPLGCQRLQMKLMQFRCNAEHLCEETGALMGPGSATLR